MRLSARAIFKRLDGSPSTATRRASRAGLGLLLLTLGGDLGAQIEPVRPPTVSALMDQLEAAFRDRDLAATLALYALPDEEARRQETEALQTLFGAEEVALSLQRPAQLLDGVQRPFDQVCAVVDHFDRDALRQRGCNLVETFLRGMDNLAPSPRSTPSRRSRHPHAAQGPSEKRQAKP